LDLKNNQQEYFKEPESYYGKSSGAFTIFKVALVTMANGGDNLGVYIPLLANVNTGDKVSITIIFLILTGIWCFLSYKLVNNRFIAPKILNYGHLILPFVLISIGMIILYTGGAISILANIF
jgi:cadmium resistance protein CadD (predicted permease)